MADDPPAERIGPPDLLSIAWHLLVAPETLLAVLGLLVITLAAAGLVPQMPLSARSNPPQWLAAQPSLVESPWIRSLRLYALSDSLWLRLLLAVLGAVLLVRLAQSVQVAWVAVAPGARAARHLRAWARCSRQEWDSDTAPADAIGEVQQRLGGQSYQWLPVGDGPVTTKVGSRRAWVLWAVPAVYAGFVAALTGTLLLITWGWQSEAWQPDPGEGRAVGSEGEVAVRMEGFDVERGGSGGVVAAITEISWRSGELELGRSRLAAGHPARRHRLAVRQLGYVPILSIRGWDEEGRPLLLQGESGSGLPTDVEVTFPNSDARPVLFLEERDKFLVLAFEPGGRAIEPALHLALTTSTGAEEVPVGVLHESGSVRFDGMQLQVEMGFRPLLQADFLPGMGLIIGGSALALLAVGLIWLIRPGLVWGAAAPSPVSGTRVRLTLVSTPGEGRRGDEQTAGLSARAGGILNCAGQATFVAMGAGATAAAAWAWRATGSLSGHPVEAVWLLAGVLLAAMSLLARRLPRRSLFWAASLAALSAVAVVTGLIT